MPTWINFHLLEIRIMATLTDYQLQHRRRMKRAIKLRADADRKVRRYTEQLPAAMAAGDAAARVCDELNRVYNQDISTETILVHTALENAFQETVQSMLEDSAPGEEALLLVTVLDANGGAALPPNVLLD